jgi:hypothetical protein
MRMRRLVVTGALLACGAAALAGPLNSGWVRGDAAWVVHVDVEAGVRSSVGRYLLENAHRWDVHACEQIRARTGMDVSSEILGLTIYGRECDGSDAVAVVHTTAAIDSFLDKLRAQEPSYRVVESAGRKLDSWMEHGSERYGHVLRREGDHRLIIVGRDQRAVEAAIAQVERREAAEEPRVLATKPRPGSVVFVAASDLGPAAERARAVVVKKMKQMRLDLGEAGGELFADVLVTTGSAADAKDVYRSIDGSVALGRLLLLQGDARFAALAEAADGLTVSAEGSKVRVSFRHDSAKALELMKQVDGHGGESKSDGDSGSR